MPTTRSAKLRTFFSVSPSSLPRPGHQGPYDEYERGRSQQVHRPWAQYVQQARRATEALSNATTDALSRFSSEELLLELLRRSISQPRRRRHETWDDWDDGREPQSYWPEEG